MSRTVVMWFRRDLRLADHRAIEAAAADGARVVPLFVVDPAFAVSGAPRRAFMAAALRSLDDAIGGELVYRHGNPSTVLPSLAAEVGAAAVYVTADHGAYGQSRDDAVAAALSASGVRLVSIDSNYAVAPGTVNKGDGSPYAVFTPFCKAWRARGWSAPAPEADVRWWGATQLSSDGPPPVANTTISLSGASEVAAHDRWQMFLPNAQHYRDRRDLPAVDGTSRLSAALRWGLVHPRQLLADLEPSPGHDTFGNELGWREFYADVLYRRPESAWHNLNRKMDAMPVDEDAAARARFERWAAGTTGYPIIDAGMRQLAATGWMHNRVRMLVGSFLVKDLHVPWQWGARHFLRHLIDGDLASNNHGWQWVAGTGTDASPYFRIFNPTTQALRFDAEGDYVRRWVPELAGLSGSIVHDPGLLRPAAYPEPMVDHATERDEAMARYRSARAGSR
ncbi:MAG: deoxyribodipyrimidine photo-lyase [Actinobacteria bacterium]|uniref:Unannotated protein n=1 Tax=freshwater metagenome TaxID=449393 RepID=A0A6J7C525_9ZZZZ|nr:deoxyribodipyrimidine photo-lyase [Actinomycetota bacterium]MSX56580.1 deoxyribodipyrimidine photo-lyase [Actinomycetota bacterium]MSZ82542.1 deoxyribodipyrimidine photo-lyase [Actinomycetota bacterium]MTB17756.1 deoxyribodipyrimidine photo-lyase [Actinomycetota bacterium]